MSCPDPGAWRAWLDNEATDSCANAAHLGSCQGCQESVATLRRDAAHASSAIALLLPDSERVRPAPHPPALHLATGAHQSGGAAPVVDLAPGTRGPAPHPRLTLAGWQRWAAGIAAALALSFLVGTADGQALAAQFLAQFRSQRFTAVTFDSARTRNPFADLEQIGTVKGGSPAARSAGQVSTLAEASQSVGFAVKQPDPASLPAGIGHTPAIRVSPRDEIRFTFDRAKARAYFDRIGHSEVTLPERFDGVSVVLTVPPAAMLEYRGADGQPGLVVGQARELAAGVDGNASLDEVRDFLLKLPNLPPETARQLRAIEDWRNTLPIPVPADRFNWQETTIAGGSGLLLVETTGLGSAAIWQRGDRVFGLAGPVRPADLQRIADTMR